MDVGRGSGFDRLGQDECWHGAIHEVDPVGNDMPPLKGPDMGEMLVGNGYVVGAQFVDDPFHLQGVPQHHCVRQQAEAAGLVHHDFVVVDAEFALVGEEQPAGQGVAGFAAVQLGLDQSAERRVVKVAQDVAGLHQTAEHGQCLGDAVVGAAGGEALQHDMGGSGSGLERCGDADKLVPLLNEESGVDGPGEQVGDGVGDLDAVRTPQSLIGQILDARHEVDAEQMAQAPQGFGEAVGVGGVQTGIEVRGVVEHTIKDVGRFPRGTGDKLGRVDADAIADVGVDSDSFVVVAEIAGMVGAEKRPWRRAETLTIGRRQATVAPEGSEVEAMKVLDNLSIGCLHGGFAHQPVRGLLEVGGRQVLDAVAHGGQAEVGAVGDQGGQQRPITIPWLWLIAGDRVEGAGETAAPVDVEQDVLDPHPRHPAFDLATQVTDFRRQRQCIGPVEAQLALLDASEVVGGQAGGKEAGAGSDDVCQFGEMLARLFGKAKIVTAFHGTLRRSSRLFPESQAPLAALCRLWRHEGEGAKRRTTVAAVRVALCATERTAHLPVGLVHRQSKPGLFAPLRVVVLELRQAEPVRMRGLVLHPHQLERDVAVAPQVQVDCRPIRLRAVSGQRLRWKQRRLQHVVRQTLGRRGVNPGRRRPLQVLAYRRPGHSGTGRDRADIVAQRNT